jgi:hypothetical protein
MSKQQFEDFLKKEKSRPVTEIDLQDRKQEWIGFVEKLYSDVRGWLKEYSDSVKVKSERIELFEEPIGRYGVDQLSIEINGKVARLKPIGTILIGTRGRVDMIGSRGTARFILADKDSTGPRIQVKVYTSEEERSKQELAEREKIKAKIDWTWKIASTPPNVKYTELNQDSFLQCLVEVING